MPYSDDASAAVHINHYQFQSIEWCGRIKRCYPQFHYTCQNCIDANYHLGQDVADNELFRKRGGEQWLKSLKLEQSWPTDNCTCEPEARSARETRVGEHLSFEEPLTGSNVIIPKGKRVIGLDHSSRMNT